MPTLKNAVFWDVTPCGSCKNRRFGGTSVLTRGIRLTSQKTSFFIVTAVNPSNVRYQLCFPASFNYIAVRVTISRLALLLFIRDSPYPKFFPENKLFLSCTQFPHANYLVESCNRSWPYLSAFHPFSYSVPPETPRLLTT
jgi:hypothetical protein